MSPCGLRYVPINTAALDMLSLVNAAILFGSLAGDVVHNGVVGATLGEGVHTWELEDDHSERMQLRDTSYPHMSSQVDGLVVRTTAPMCSEHTSVVAHLLSA